MSHVEDALRAAYDVFRSRYTALKNVCISLEPDPLGDWPIAQLLYPPTNENGCLRYAFDVLATDETPTLYLTSHEYAHGLHYIAGGEPHTLQHPDDPVDPVLDQYFRVRRFPVSYIDHVKKVRAMNFQPWGVFPGEMFAESIAAIATGGTEKADTYDVPFTPELRIAVETWAKSLKNVRTDTEMTYEQFKAWWLQVYKEVNVAGTFDALKVVDANLATDLALHRHDQQGETSIAKIGE